MHLSPRLFALNSSLPTMKGTKGKEIKPGDNLTTNDVREIVLLYECASNLEWKGMKLLNGLY